MERTRELGAEEARIEEGTVAGARRALMREIVRSAPPDAARRSRRRRWAGIGIGGLVAGTAVTAIVVGSVLAPATAPTASAAEVLRDAADVALGTGAVSAPAGEYLLIRTVDEGLRFWDADMPAADGQAWMRFNNGDRVDAEAALLTRGETQLYVPSDRRDEWVRVSSPATIIRTFGDRAAEARADAADDPSRPSPAQETLRAVGGSYQHMDGVDGEGTVTSNLDGRTFWAEMPSTEPRELVSWLRARVGEPAGSSASDSSIVETLTDDPTLALAPADVRAAALRALALLDGSRIVSADGDITTIRFEWTTEWWKAWKDIRIDTQRGLIVGVTSSGAVTGEEPKISGLPKWDSHSTYEVSIVNSAP
jgi:hypothetical protein